MAVVSIGLEHLVRGSFPAGLLPVPPKLPGRLGLVLAGMVLPKTGRAAGSELGVLFFALALVLHGPAVVAKPAHGSEWTGSFELIAFAGGGFIWRLRV